MHAREDGDASLKYCFEALKARGSRAQGGRGERSELWNPEDTNPYGKALPRATQTAPSLAGLTRNPFYTQSLGRPASFTPGFAASRFQRLRNALFSRVIGAVFIEQDCSFIIPAKYFSLYVMRQLSIFYFAIEVWLLMIFAIHRALSGNRADRQLQKRRSGVLGS